MATICETSSAVRVVGYALVAAGIRRLSVGLAFFVCIATDGAQLMYLCLLRTVSVVLGMSWGCLPLVG